jgi:hypothetical protein
MGVLIFLLIIGALVLTAVYLMQFYIELEGNNEKIIKDGLINELITNAVADPNPDSFLIDHEDGTITMGRIVIRSKYADMFWFPYKVEKLPKEYTRRVTSDDWGGTIGYVRRYSKDYQHIKALLKQDKTSIEKTQRQKLDLNK